ncbi:nucleoporin FG repeat-containing protein [Aspergillus melleus]|uniref:nucleoporin FG repeat-containing protein n=1 Tax=Aspergillus melleus TaxID=138277 RepID=UPI001E8DED03|nr:nuclear pore complex subunit [Aspergillus melleus]KAH8430353.1 nuclear pore complex subunit [Aspergillus melleus]
MASANPTPLFGGLGASTPSSAPTAPNNSASVFGNSSATGTNGSLFGTVGQQQQQPPPVQSSIFGQSQAQNTAAPSSQLSGQATQPAFFNSLLERGKKRPLSALGQTSNFEQLPSLQLGLDDIRRKARELGTGSPSTQGQAPNSKAHYLLAASGVSAGHALRDLKALEPYESKSREQEATFDPDNQKFLRNIQQRGRQVMIAESLTRTNKDFDLFLEGKVDLNWEEQRRKIFQHFGLTQRSEATGDTKGSFGRSMRQSKLGPSSISNAPFSSRRSVFGRSALDKSVIGTPAAGSANQQLFEDPMERTEGSTAPDMRHHRERMGNYAAKVQLLNSARLQSHTFPVLHEFSSVETDAGGDVRYDSFGFDLQN